MDPKHLHSFLKVAVLEPLRMPELVVQNYVNQGLYVQRTVCEYVGKSPSLERSWQMCYSNIFATRRASPFTIDQCSTLHLSWSHGHVGNDRKIENMMKLYSQGIAMDTACYV